MRESPSWRPSSVGASSLCPGSARQHVGSLLGLPEWWIDGFLALGYTAQLRRNSALESVLPSEGHAQKTQGTTIVLDPSRISAGLKVPIRITRPAHRRAVSLWISESAEFETV